MKEREEGDSEIVWKTVERPGYLGKKRDEVYRHWDSAEGYGKGNWRLVNEIGGEVFTYEDILWKIYVPGYARHFLNNPREALFVTNNFSYGCDKDLCTKQQSFDIYALYNRPGVVNQFHHVAFNIALEYYLGPRFRGLEPLQVREGKPGTSDIEQPSGYHWSPGRIKSVRSDLIPSSDQVGWWEQGSIEAVYQLSKVLQIKAN